MSIVAASETCIRPHLVLFQPPVGISTGVGSGTPCQGLTFSTCCSPLDSSPINSLVWDGSLFVFTHALLKAQKVVMLHWASFLPIGEENWWANFSSFISASDTVYRMVF